MSKPGPRPRPTRLKLLRGERSDRVNDAEPIPSDAPIEAPTYLDDDARAVWDRLATDLERRGVLTAWDVDGLAVFCTAVVHHRRAVEYVNRTSVLLTQERADRPATVRHPATILIRQQAEIIRSFGAEFGLTPAARSQLSPIPQRDTSRTSKARLLTTITDGDD